MLLSFITRPNPHRTEVMFSFLVSAETSNSIIYVVIMLHYDTLTVSVNNSRPSDNKLLKSQALSSTAISYNFTNKINTATPFPLIGIHTF